MAPTSHPTQLTHPDILGLDSSREGLPVRLTFPYQTERLGAVRIYGVQHVFELDSDPAEPEAYFRNDGQPRSHPGDP